jgi:hypothetical protein
VTALNQEGSVELRLGVIRSVVVALCCTAASLHAQVGLHPPKQLADTAPAPTLFGLRPPSADLPASPLARTWPFVIIRPARPTVWHCPMPVIALDSTARDRMPIIRHDSSHSERMPVASGGCVNDLQRKREPHR